MLSEPDEVARTLLELQKEGVYGQKHPLVVQAEQVGGRWNAMVLFGMVWC